MLLRPEESVLQKIDYVAVAIKEHRSGGTHCGLVYRDTGGILKFIHLGWYFQLHVNHGSELPSGNYYISPVEVDEVDRKFLAALCDHIATEKPDIPYGISSLGVSFRADGQLLITRSGAGLTCATFVLAVFQAQGLILLKMDEWPKGVNREWAAKVINDLRGNPDVPDTYIEMMEQDAGQVQRFRPEEVAGCSPCLTWPSGFSEATKRADAVMSALRAADGAS